MKTKILLTLVLLASGCSPALEESHLKILAQAKAHGEALEIPSGESETFSKLLAFQKAREQLAFIPMHSSWRYVFLASGNNVSDAVNYYIRIQRDFIRGRESKSSMTKATKLMLRNIAMFIGFCDRFIATGGDPIVLKNRPPAP
jgi:glycerol-3-phosphate cytidylyltransferase-like family protein